jgi:hypothetical protein
MKKSILFACLALLVYLISTILLGVWAKQLNLIQDDTQTSFPIKEKFHHLNIAINTEGYAHLNITEGSDQNISFKNLPGGKDKPEYKVVDDTLYVKMNTLDQKGYYTIIINAVSLRSVLVRCKENLNVAMEMNGSVKNVILGSGVDVNFNSCGIDTLNIQTGAFGHISIDTCRINMLNFYQQKGQQFNFSINRSPMPEINQFDERIITKPSE